MLIISILKLRIYKAITYIKIKTWPLKDLISLLFSKFFKNLCRLVQARIPL